MTALARLGKIKSTRTYFSILVQNFNIEKRFASQNFGKFFKLPVESWRPVGCQQGVFLDKVFRHLYQPFAGIKLVICHCQHT